MDFLILDNRKIEFSKAVFLESVKNFDIMPDGEGLQSVLAAVVQMRRATSSGNKQEVYNFYN